MLQKTSWCNVSIFASSKVMASTDSFHKPYQYQHCGGIPLWFHQGDVIFLKWFLWLRLPGDMLFFELDLISVWLWFGRFWIRRQYSRCNPLDPVRWCFNSSNYQVPCRLISLYSMHVDWDIVANLSILHLLVLFGQPV